MSLIFNTGGKAKQNNLTRWVKVNVWDHYLNVKLSNISKGASKSCCSFRKHLHIFTFLSLSFEPHHCQTAGHHLTLTVIPHSELPFFVSLWIFFSPFLFVFICSSGAHPHLLSILFKSTWTSQGPSGRLSFFVSHFRRPLPSPSLPPAISPSLHLLVHLSVWPIFSGGLFLCLLLL